MIERETAIRAVDGRQIEAPEKRQPFTLEVGDVVQLKADGKKAAGEIGVIIGSHLYRHKRGFGIAYTVKLSDSKSIQAGAGRLRFLRREEEETTADTEPTATDKANI